MPDRNVDEGRSIADYYRGAFRKCEACDSLELADGIVCVRCSIRLSSIVPEAVMRDPDVSDVRRVLLELEAARDVPRVEGAGHLRRVLLATPAGHARPV